MSRKRLERAILPPFSLAAVLLGFLIHQHLDAQEFGDSQNVASKIANEISNVLEHRGFATANILPSIAAALQIDDDVAISYCETIVRDLVASDTTFVDAAFALDLAVEHAFPINESELALGHDLNDRNRRHPAQAELIRAGETAAQAGPIACLHGSAVFATVAPICFENLIAEAERAIRGAVFIIAQADSIEDVTGFMDYEDEYSFALTNHSENGVESLIWASTETDNLRQVSRDTVIPEGAW